MPWGGATNNLVSSFGRDWMGREFKSIVLHEMSHVLGMFYCFCGRHNNSINANGYNSQRIPVLRFVGEEYTR